MFDNLVTYHILKHAPLPTSDALAYQYILAGNGVFVRAKTRFFSALLPAATCTVRGLPLLRAHFQLLVPRIPAQLLDTILADARQARRPDNGLNEVFYQFHLRGQRVQVRKPPQQCNAATVLATGTGERSVICDLHSHGNMFAFFSHIDNADEQGIRLYAVAGRLDTLPEMRLRVGVYGYWLQLPLTAVFTSSGPFKDLYLEEKYEF
jgi:PRTRC genetic system protein A